MWCARQAIDGPFAVIGADDFFGRDAFGQLAAFLTSAAANAKRDLSSLALAKEETRNPKPANAAAAFAMIGYRLSNTLSENGAVSRGVCATAADGTLEQVVEHTGIRRDDVGPGRKFSGAEIVSMNCWAFTPAFFPALDRQWRDFVAALDNPEQRITDQRRIRAKEV